MSARYALGAVAAMAGLAALGRRSGARNEAPDQEWSAWVQRDAEVGAGISFAGPALDELIWGLWDKRYLDFWEVEDDGDAEENLKAEIEKALGSLGLAWADLVLVLGTLQVDEDERGRGRGREIVARIEAAARRQGLKAIFLQAGSLDGGAHSAGFWARMGYEEIPGSLYFDDTIRYKVLT